MGQEHRCVGVECKEPKKHRIFFFFGPEYNSELNVTTLTVVC